MTPPLWKNPSASTTARVEDLLSRMTLAEKVSQLDDAAPALERLELPAFRYGGEALHGLCNTGKATTFPMPIGLAATFDPALVERVASATSDEMRAKFHDPAWCHSPRVTLMVYSPVINILRDPRWGRAQETYGEDPYLTGAMGAAYVRGLQGQDPRYLKIAACAKHLGVHSGPETLRTRFNAVVSQQDMEETYLPAFRTLIEAGAATVMATYNRVNGEHCCAHSYMIDDFLRRQLGFEGVVMSDGGALGSLHRKNAGEAVRLHAQFAGQADGEDGHNLTADVIETAGLCLKHNCDLELGRHAYRLAAQAIERGLITEAEIDRALRRILTLRFRVGALDPLEQNPHSRIPRSRIQCAEHLTLARQAAEQSIVLLKNERDTLPLRSGRDSVVLVTGPTSVDLQVLMGNFYKSVSGDLRSILEGVVAAAPEGVTVNHSQGAFLCHENLYDSDWYLGLSEWSDTVVACVGYSPLMEGEQGECIGALDGGDKSSIRLPQNQLKLLRQLRSKIEQNPRPPRLVVVVTTGCPLELEEVAALADALVLAWYPGEQGGTAVGRVLWGEANPSGRLPATFPKSLSDLPPYPDYAMAGRTYRYQTAAPLYPFGFGLSYTQFALSPTRLSQNTFRDGDRLTVEAEVVNTGPRSGATTVQLYVSAPESLPGRPHRTLKGLFRVELAPGARQTVRLEINAPTLRHFDPRTKAWSLIPGTHTLALAEDSGNAAQQGVPLEVLA